MTHPQAPVFRHFRGRAGQGDTSPMDSVNRVNFVRKAAAGLNESMAHG